MHKSFREKPGSTDLGQPDSAGDDPSSQFSLRSNMDLAERGEARRTMPMGARWKF